jgi:FixJ family two-component response regulator
MPRTSGIGSAKLAPTTSNEAILSRKARMAISTQHEARPVVFVVDDDVTMRESLELLIAGAGWESETFASAREFLAHPRAPAPSCLVLDVSPPDINGLELQGCMGAELSHTPIVVISGHVDVPLAVRAMKQGAADFLTKPFSDDALLGAVGDALDRSRAALLQEGELRALRERHASLTPREREVMALVVAGRLNKLVAHELGISEVTVKAHRGCVMRKMKAGSVANLVRIAARLDGQPAPRPATPPQSPRSIPSSNGYAPAFPV